MSLMPIATGSDLCKALYDELGAAIKGGVYLRNDTNFLEYSKMFNGNVKTAARAVACPLDAEDVSRIMIFCSKHSLSPSVKAGGYGTAGWAIGGDVIIDMSRIAEMDIEVPKPDGSYTSFRNDSHLVGKGKEKEVETIPESGTGPSSGKRRREDDAELRSYDDASGAVAEFMRIPLSSESPVDARPLMNKRRLDVSSPVIRQTSVGSNSSDAAASPSESGSNKSRAQSGEQTSSYGSGSGSGSGSTAATSPSPPQSGFVDKSPTISSTPFSARAQDPFGYMNLGPLALYQPTPTPASLFRASGHSTSSMMANPNIVASPQAQLTRATPIHPHAYVTFGAGKRQKEIDIYTSKNPIEATSLSGSPGYIPYHVPFAAHPVGSAIMISGGFGFQSRLRGLSIDILVEVEMVLADGRIVVVNKDSHPDLWWAVRGAGPALGIATRYKAKAFPVPVVFAGNLIYRFHRATAPSLIKHFRDCIKGAPRELYCNVLLTAGPAGKDSLVVIQMCYLGPREEGLEYLQALSSWDGERCLLNEVDEKSFLYQQDSVAQVLRGKAGSQWFIRSALISSLPDEIIHKTVMEFSTGPVGCTWLFELAGGAILDYEDNCLPKAQREASFNIAALHQWPVGHHDDRCINSAEDWISKTLLPVTRGGPLPSFLGRHETPARTMASFGDSWDRLVEVKKQYDPSNVFRNSFWPLNAEGEIVSPHSHEPSTP